jgi:hypothetical protein
MSWYTQVYNDLIDKVDKNPGATFWTCSLVSIVIFIIYAEIDKRIKVNAYLKEQARKAAQEKARKEAEEARWEKLTRTQKVTEIGSNLIGCLAVGVLVAPMVVLFAACTGDKNPIGRVAGKTIMGTLGAVEPLLGSKKPKRV